MTPKQNRIIDSIILLAGLLIMLLLTFITIALEIHPVSIIHIVMVCTAVSVLGMVVFKYKYVVRKLQEQAKLDAVWNKLQGNQDENTDYLIY